MADMSVVPVPDVGIPADRGRASRMSNLSRASRRMADLSRALGRMADLSRVNSRVASNLSLANKGLSRSMADMSVAD